MEEKDLTKIQRTMFSQEKAFLEMAEVFEALSSDCRLEIVYLLARTESLPSGEISRLTNCTPSQTSQYLAKMYRAGIVKKSRSWREVSYSLDESHPFVGGIILAIRNRLIS